ncbi:MAG: LON peptidase substrate-binding domain-containing protein [Pseudomonadota bacterium]|nr:LON peptidase substrate-binding domain-containing protein [Pseudomonadota bacterium]
MLLLKLFSAGRSRETVPIFPLQTVLYPGALLPLKIFEVRYMDMARACLKDGRPFGICLIKEGLEVGLPAIPEPIGCLARIAECDMEELGILKVKAEGVERFRIVSSEVSKAGLIVGEIEKYEPETLAGDAAGLAECVEFLRKVIAGIGAQRFAGPFEFGDASWVGFRLAEILPLRTDVKQKLLELTDPGLRVAVLHRFLRQQQLI